MAIIDFMTPHLFYPGDNLAGRRGIAADLVY